MTTPVKNPTAWQPPSGSGYVVDVGAEDIVTNSGLYIVTNAGDNIVTTPDYDIGKYPTQWTATGV